MITTDNINCIACKNETFTYEKDGRDGNNVCWFDCDKQGRHLELHKNNNTCLCKDGYELDKQDVCRKKPTPCPANGKWNYTLEECGCVEGFKSEGGNCVIACDGFKEKPITNVFDKCDCETGFERTTLSSMKPDGTNETWEVC